MHLVVNFSPQEGTYFTLIQGKWKTLCPQVGAACGKFPDVAITI